MAFDCCDAAEGFANAAEQLLSALSLFGVGNLPADAQAGYTNLNNALSDYQEYMGEIEAGTTPAY